MSETNAPYFAPWEHRQIHKSGYCGEEPVTTIERFVHSADGKRIANVCEVIDDFAKAQARLIAAAPDMYEALLDCVATLSRLGKVTTAYELACKALAKAKGETS